MKYNQNAGTLIRGKQLFDRQAQFTQPGIAPDIICCQQNSPENLAAILRVAEAAGSKSITHLTNEPENAKATKKICRLSRHADNSVNLQSATVDSFIQSNNHQHLIALDITTTSTDIYSTSLPEVCQFVIGNEKHGIQTDVLESCHQAVHIPMYGINGSMNVSHALAIALFEWHRQHRK